MLSHEELESAIAEASVPCLLMVLVQLSGDLRWLGERYRVSRPRGMEDDITGGMPRDVQDEVRCAALDAIEAWQAGAPVAIPVPSEALMVEMLSWSMGERISDEYGAMLVDDLVRAVDPDSMFTAGSPAPADFRVLVVGAGISGILAGAVLGRAGIAYTIVERSHELGGVWLENTYPGAGVDVPSHLYSYSFAAHDWPHHFATRDEVKHYLERVADDFDVRSHVRFDTTVREANFDEQRLRWVVTLDNGGNPTTTEANVVISAVGAFNSPVMPQIPGIGDFQGASFHTARWPADVDLTGARVAVIGNGASAMQVVPAIVDSVKSLVVFQRAPQWAQPFPLFKREISPAVRRLLAEVPLYRSWVRLRLTWIFHDKLYQALQKDASWANPERSINSINDGHREYLTRYVESQLRDRPDLLEELIPDYPPFGKRMLMDNGWYAALSRPNARLVSRPIERIEATGVVTADGEKIDLDAIVFATGFDVVRFVSTFDVVGRDGVLLRDKWDDDDGRAYLGLAVPGFPNFFCLYGPNTQPGHGGSLITTVEAQMTYIMQLVRRMLTDDLAAVECKPQVYDEYAAEVDAAHDRMIWTHPGMSTYYRNARGRVVVNSPFRNIDFWTRTRTADLNDYELLRPALSREGADNG